LPTIRVAVDFDEVNFKCQRCGACCHHRRPEGFGDLVAADRLAEFVEKSNLIYLTREEIEKISQRYRLPAEEFVDTLHPYNGRLVKVEDRGRKVILDLPVMKSKEDSSCVFFREGSGCSIYPLRPRACRLFPFRVEEESTAKGDILLKIGYNPTCPGIGRGEAIDKRSLEELVAEQFRSRAEELAEEILDLKARGLISYGAEVYRTVPGRGRGAERKKDPRL